MAIDPTTPLTPILPSVPAGTAPDSVVVAQAVARQALANATAELGQIVGRPATPQTPKTGAPVEQAGQTSAQDTGHAADASGAAKGGRPAPQAPIPKSTPETRMVRAVRTAAAEAVPRQAGLAPLMANVRAVVDHPDMPVEVRDAGRALLAKTPQVAELTTSQGLRQAVERSGVFLEARMARAAATPADLEVPMASPPQNNDIKAALLVFRGALSAWLGQMTPRTITEPEPDAPLDVPPEADEPMANSRPPSLAGAAQQASAPSSASPVAQAHPGPAPISGQASEAATMVVAPPMAEGDEVTTKPSPQAAPVAPPPEDEAIVARFGSFVAPLKATPNPATMRAALSPLIQAGLLAEDGVAEEPPSAAALEPKNVVARGYGAAVPDVGRSKVPPPPYAGGPMAGQKPATVALSADRSPADVVRGLLKETGGALARQDLMQIASLPEAPHHGDAEVAEARPQGARLNLDLPFMTPQGVAVAQFEISRDGGGSGGGAAGSVERTFKARFSIDIEPLGPVHALVTLTGARTRVSLWAERAETIARLRAGEESLGAALRQAELAPEVAVHSGAPPTPGASPLGHFVDQAS